MYHELQRASQSESCRRHLNIWSRRQSARAVLVPTARFAKSVGDGRRYEGPRYAGRGLFSSGGHVWKRRGDVTILRSDDAIGRPRHAPAKISQHDPRHQLYFGHCLPTDTNDIIPTLKIIYILNNSGFRIVNDDDLLMLKNKMDVIRLGNPLEPYFSININLFNLWIIIIKLS